MSKTRVRRPKENIVFVRNAFAKKGDKLLTNTYVGTKQILVYKCGGCKRPRTTTFNNYSREYRCKECSIRKRMNPKGKVLQKIILRSAHYSMTDVCRVFAFDYGNFCHHVHYNLLPKPTKRIGAKNYYTDECLQKIRDAVYLEGDKIDDKI